jgi:hypothetical protein
MGCVGFFAFTSCKIFTANDGHNNVVLLPAPDVAEQSKTHRILLRAVPEPDTRIEWKSARELRNFTALALSLMRTENETARRYVRAFDQEMFYECGVAGIPDELVTFVREYMALRPHPNQPAESGVGDLLQYLRCRLVSIVLADSMNQRHVFTHAKNVTALCARTARELYCMGESPEGIPGEQAYVWREIEVLQEYQLRQLVEVCIFEEVTEGSGLFMQMQDVLRKTGRENQYMVSYEGGVTYRYTPDFNDRIAGGAGPEFNDRIFGREVAGMDGVPFLACSGGMYVPINFPNGDAVLEKVWKSASGELNDADATPDSRPPPPPPLPPPPLGHVGVYEHGAVNTPQLAQRAVQLRGQVAGGTLTAEEAQEQMRAARQMRARKLNLFWLIQKK